MRRKNVDMISLIAAMGQQRELGFEGKMPWHLPADLQHFKAITLGKPVVMGRKTYESIGKPLPERLNIIMTRDKYFYVPDCVIAHTLVEAVETVDETKEIMVIGGSHLFEQFLPFASRMYLTFIQASFPSDTYFPEWDSDEWQVIDEELHNKDEKNSYDYQFVTLDRVVTT